MNRTAKSTRATKEAQLDTMSLFDDVDESPAMQGSGLTPQAEAPPLNSAHRFETVTEAETKIESAGSRNQDSGPLSRLTAEPFGAGAVSESAPSGPPSSPAQNGHVAAQVYAEIEPEHSAGNAKVENSLSLSDTDSGGNFPSWRRVRLNQIELDPSVLKLYTARGIPFPPEWAPGYLTPEGFQKLARFLPIQVYEDENELLCFAGVRLLMAARNSLPPENEIAVLVYPELSTALILDALEVEQEILYVWHRQTEKDRKALDLRCLQRESLNGIRFNFIGKEQDKWMRILKISLKTLQNRLASLRKRAKGTSSFSMPLNPGI